MPVKSHVIPPAVKGGRGGHYTITVGLALGGDLVVVNDIVVWKWEVCIPGTVSKVIGNVVDAPVGADIIIDVLSNLTSIFGDDKLVIADGATRGVQTVFASDPQRFALADRITVNVLQIGSTTPGQSVTLEIKVKAD